MSTAFARIHNPEERPNDSAGTFRCDDATVAQVLDWWEQNPARVFTSDEAESERKRLWKLLRGTMGTTLVVSCRPYVLDNFIRATGKPRKKNNTLRRWNATLQQPFNEAETLGLIIKNPFRGLSYPEGDQGRDWTDEETTEILANASDAFAELIIGMRLSSLRPIEACELEWSQIRHDAGNIKLDKHKSFRRTKAAAHVPLNQPLIDLFAQIKARNNPGRRVFLTPKKKPWTRSHADHTFRHLRDKLALAPDLKLHGCRHSFATGAILNRVDVMFLQQILRHADIRTTQRYVHLVNKTDHLSASMNQAVDGVQKIIKANEYTPLFDGLE